MFQEVGAARYVLPTLGALVFGLLCDGQEVVTHVPTETGRSALRGIRAVEVVAGDSEHVQIDSHELTTMIERQLGPCRELVLRKSDSDAKEVPLLYVAIDVRPDGERRIFAVTVEVLERVPVPRLRGVKLDVATWQHTEPGMASASEAAAAVARATSQAVSAFQRDYAAANKVSCTAPAGR